MVGVRKLKHISLTLLLAGVGTIALTYKWFFDQHQASSRLTGHPRPPLLLRPPSLSSADQQQTPEQPRNQQYGDQAKIQHHEISNKDSSQISDKQFQAGGNNEKDSSELKSKNPESNDQKSSENGANKDALSKWEEEYKKRIAANKENRSNRSSESHSRYMLKDEDLPVKGKVVNGVTRKTEVRVLHRTFSKMALRMGNVYASSGSQMKGAGGMGESGVIHVVSVVSGDDVFRAVMTMMFSVTKNAANRNVTFHLITNKGNRANLKDAIDNSPLSNAAFEIIEYPSEWAQSKSMSDVALFRLSDLLAYIGGRLIVLDPYTLVTGDLGDLVMTHINPDHWVAMGTLCNTDATSSLPEERYRDYLNFSHEAISKLDLPPDECVSSPAAMVVDIFAIRINNLRRKMWQWIRLSDKSPIFLNNQDGDASVKGAHCVVFHNHVSPLKPQWYTRVSEKSSPSEADYSLYHWVGQGQPWESSSPVGELWKKYLVTST